MCSVCFELEDKVKEDMQETLSHTRYSMAKAFQIFAKMCGQAKDHPETIARFLLENNYITDLELLKIDEDIKSGKAKLVTHNIEDLRHV